MQRKGRKRDMSYKSFRPSHLLPSISLRLLASLSPPIWVIAYYLSIILWGEAVREVDDLDKLARLIQFWCHYLFLREIFSSVWLFQYYIDSSATQVWSAYRHCSCNIIFHCIVSLELALLDLIPFTLNLYWLFLFLVYWLVNTVVILECEMLKTVVL